MQILRGCTIISQPQFRDCRGGGGPHADAVSFCVLRSSRRADQRSRSAVITGILAPSGPNRTRVLAALNKDERVQSHLPPFMSLMLTKTFNDYIIRPAELEEFEACLEQHQRATGSSGETILQRAIRDHNVGACGKVSLLLSSRANPLKRRCMTISDLRLWEPCSISMLMQRNRRPASELHFSIDGGTPADMTRMIAQGRSVLPKCVLSCTDIG